MEFDKISEEKRADFTSPLQPLNEFDESCIARLCHIGHGFLKFYLILLNSEIKI